MTKLFIPKERGPGETRVAATPETVKKLTGLGGRVTVEAGAGVDASFPDADYEAAGATVAPAGEELWSQADAVLKVGPLIDSPSLGKPEHLMLAQGSLIVGLLDPFRNLATVRSLAEHKVSSLPMELIPRVTRAQSMDALSSQANIAGYKSVVLAASRLGRYFPLLMTAAGTIRPAKVVIMGAGVAGLQAVATAKRLGAVVEVSDIRPAVKEQVASLGARFIDLPDMESGEGKGGYAKEMGEDFLTRQRQILTERVAAADVVITTAQVPGKKAPTLLTAAMVEAMPPGGVVVDLAAAQGGNCELTRPGEETTHRGVLILGPLNLPATLAHDASSLYARNVLELLKEVLVEGEIEIDPESEIAGATLLTHDGEIVHRGIAELAQEATA